MDLCNLDTSDNTNEKLTGKFKHEFGSKLIEEFVILSPKTYSFKHWGKTKGKEKGIMKCNNAKHEDYYNELMFDTEIILEECRVQKVGDNSTTTKTGKTSLSSFDDKTFYVKIIKSYPHNESLYLFKRDLLNKINTTPIKLLIKPEVDEDNSIDPLIIILKS